MVARPEAWGQEVKSANTVAEEWIQVNSSSATVLQWFEWIENHKNCRGKPSVDGGGGMAGAELRCIGGSDYPFKHT